MLIMRISKDMTNEENPRHERHDAIPQDLLQTLEQLEALLIHSLVADPSLIAPASRSCLLSLAHDLTCSAIQMAQPKRTI